MTKPVVRIREARIVYFPFKRLTGIPVDHPSVLVSNRGPVLTSEIIRVDIPHGEIETENTVYRIEDWSRNQKQEWQDIAARLTSGPVAGIGVSERVRGEDSGRPEVPADSVQV